MPKDLTNVGGQFASKDGSQNTTINAATIFLRSLPFVVRPETMIDLRNDLELGDHGLLPYVTGSVPGEISESYKDLLMRSAAGDVYDADKTLLRLFVQLPLDAPAVELDTTDRGKILQPQAYTNIAQFQAKWAGVHNAKQCKTLLDSVYPGPNNQHLAETAFPHKH